MCSAAVTRSFVDNAYDCSGSVSYALAAGGLLSAPETSGTLESWGAPGPGKWITVYANAGHTYMYVNLGGGWMRYDTSGRSGVLPRAGSRRSAPTKASWRGTGRACSRSGSVAPGLALPRTGRPGEPGAPEDRWRPAIGPSGAGRRG